MAFVVSHDGGEVGDIYIMNVDTKKLYLEKIGPSWFGVFGWTPDSKGFIYGLMNNRNTKSMSSLKNHKTMYHRLNTDPSKDNVIFSKKNILVLDLSQQPFTPFIIVQITNIFLVFRRVLAIIKISFMLRPAIC